MKEKKKSEEGKGDEDVDRVNDGVEEEGDVNENKDNN